MPRKRDCFVLIQINPIKKKLKKLKYLPYYKIKSNKV